MFTLKAPPGKQKKMVKVEHRNTFTKSNRINSLIARNLYITKENCRTGYGDNAVMHWIISLSTTEIRKREHQ